MSKITIQVEPEVIEEARRLAAADGTSVSSLFSRLIRYVANYRSAPTLGAAAQRATGLVAIPDRIDARDIVADALVEKHQLEE